MKYWKKDTIKCYYIDNVFFLAFMFKDMPSLQYNNFKDLFNYSTLLWEENYADK